MQEVLTAALASEWTPKQALILERTENVESVVDAVQRVASQIPQVQLLLVTRVLPCKTDLAHMTVIQSAMSLQHSCIVNDIDERIAG